MEILFATDLPFGRCVAVALPIDEQEIAATLHPEEQAFAQTLGAGRRGGWIGGRVALRTALQQLDVRLDAPLLATPRGAPLLPDGISGSVSHKRSIAVALVAKASGAGIGVDVEQVDPPRLSIAPRVLTERERAHLATLHEEERWRDVLTRFSIKEAIYKALDPFVQRHVAFSEVELAFSSDEMAVRFFLREWEGPFEAAIHWFTHGEVIISSARVLKK